MKPSLNFRIDPSLFYGTAISTLCGLALGLAMHGPWQDDQHGGGPQTIVASEAAAELARPPGDSDIIEASVPQDQTAAYADIAYADFSQLPADPLPVTRLSRRGGTAIPAAAEVERVAADQVDQVNQDSVITVGDFKDDAPTPVASTPSNLVYAQTSYPQDNH